MQRKQKLCISVLAVLLFTSYFLAGVRHVRAVGALEAGDAIAGARAAVVSGYSAVADAERAGANVTRLLVTLNGASDLLSKADLALSSGKYDVALALATECQQTLSGFSREALALKDDASQRNSSDFTIYEVGSVLGTVLVIATSLFLWILLKRKYDFRGSVSNES